MNGPVPMGLREKSWPIFCMAVGDSGASGESATIRRNGAYGCLRRTRTVWASTTSAPSYGPRNARATPGAPSGSWMRSNVNFTLPASNGVPSWNFTLRRSLNV